MSIHEVLRAKGMSAIESSSIVHSLCNEEGFQVWNGTRCNWPDGRRFWECASVVSQLIRAGVVDLDLSYSWEWLRNVANPEGLVRRFFSSESVR